QPYRPGLQRMDGAENVDIGISIGDLPQRRAMSLGDGGRRQQENGREERLERAAHARVLSEWPPRWPTLYANLMKAAPDLERIQGPRQGWAVVPVVKTA